ncbi:CDP-glycerol glycerophosphotransferase family protein [Halococcus sediminicola]|uniref:CDP-glycerol glycerophosphotransferase family protein n=1 Tax=Halococcus sediminicola TaxID=1264579 RepID=UPI0006785369|nr:CDP-glycerol glycerophosphotransferase family protein [Halococcus sediminicola]
MALTRGPDGSADNGWLSRLLLWLRAGHSYVRTAGTFLFFGVLFVCSLVWPRDERLWVFGARGGEAFLDNSKHLYLHVLESCPNVRPVWLAKDNELVAELDSHGYEAYHAHSARGTYLNLRAELVFVSHGVADVNRWCCGGATVVGLWHGVALKQLGWDHGYGTGSLPWRLLQRCKRAITDRYSYFTVTSEAMIEPFVSAFRFDPERVVVTGYPRNDALVDGEAVPGLAADERVREMLASLPSESDVLLYLPTYHAATEEYVLDHLDLSMLDEFLRRIDAYLLVKLHPSERLDTDFTAFDRLVPLPGTADAYSILPETDALITDYSSVYFDYLLLDKPIVFYPFDLDDYRSERGFYLDYETVTPGPIASDFEELCSSLEAVLTDDEYAAEREAVRNRFMQLPDVNRSATVCRQFASSEPSDTSVAEHDRIP